MKLLVAVDQKWGIGYQGQLQVRLSDDMKYFRKLTEGSVVIFGRKTLATFPGGQALPHRTNIVLTRNHNLAAEGLYICHNLSELADLLDRLRPADTWLIGGESIYRQLLPCCSQAYVTQIERTGPADVYFPDLDRDPVWKLVSTEPWQVAQNQLSAEPDLVRFRFCRYENSDIKQLSLHSRAQQCSSEAAGSEQQY